MPRQPRNTVPLRTNGAGSLSTELLYFLCSGHDFFGSFTDSVESQDPLNLRVITTHPMKDEDAMREIYFAHKKELWKYAETKWGKGTPPDAYHLFENKNGSQHD